MRRLLALLALVCVTGCARSPKLLLDTSVPGASDVLWVRGDSCVAVGLMGRGVSIVDVATGRVRASWIAEALPSQVAHGLAASATGETLAVATQDSVRVLLTADARTVFVAPGGGRALALSNDGTRLAWSDGTYGRVLEVPSGVQHSQHRIPTERGGLVWLSRLQQFAWTDPPRVIFLGTDSLPAGFLGDFPDGPLGPLSPSGPGGTLAVGEGGTAISVWDTPGRTRRWRIGLQGEDTFNTMALSADTWYLATVRGGEVRVRWAYTGKRVARWFPNDGGEVRDLAFSRTGHRLATVGADGRVRVWDLPSFDKEQR